MSSSADYRSPVWIALAREAGIAGSTLASGATLLRKANAAYHGMYNEAFFNLSIGLERLAKLIFIVEHAVQHNGKFPDDETLRRHYGHDLERLLAYTNCLSQEYLKGHEFGDIPDTDIHKAIVGVLSDFARSTRYYNLDLLTQSNAAGKTEPLVAWYQRVGEPILGKHYSPRQRARDAETALILEMVMGEFTLVRRTREDGMPIEGVHAAALSEAQTEVVAKYSQLYVLQIIRHLVSLLWQVERAAHAQALEIPSLHEFFVVFYNRDEYFKGRRTYSVYPI